MTTTAYQELLFKVIVVGDSGTGKSSLIKRYVHNVFSSVHKATMGVDFAQKTTQGSDNQLITVQYWDIAGQERYRKMSRIYYKDAIAAMIVFDVSSQDTFEAVEKWKQDVNEKVFLPDGNPVPCILVANKVDLRNDVNMNQIAEYAEKNGYIGVVETSALTNLNVASAFQMVTDHVMKDSKHVLKKEIDEDYGLPLSMEKTSTPPQSESYCCGGMTSRY